MERPHQTARFGNMHQRSLAFLVVDRTLRRSHLPNMYKFIVALTLIASLSGCLYQQQVDTCASYGHRQGELGFEGCMRAEQEHELIKSQQLTNGLLGLTAIYSTQSRV